MDKAKKSPSRLVGEILALLAEAKAQLVVAEKLLTDIEEIHDAKS